MDLEKAYDTIDWHGMWQMIRTSIWSCRIFVESSAEFYVDCREWVRVGNNVSGFLLMMD